MKNNRKNLNRELPQYVNKSDIFLYICDAKRKITDKKCSGTACKFFKNGDCERTTDYSYAKNEFDWKNFEFLEHREREGTYDYDIWSEINKNGEIL